MKRLVLGVALVLATTASAAAAEPSINVMLVGFNPAFLEKMETLSIGEYSEEIAAGVGLGNIAPLKTEDMTAYGYPSGVVASKRMTEYISSFFGFQAGDTHLCFSVPGGTVLDSRRAKVGSDPCISITGLSGNDSPRIVLIAAE